MAKPDPITDDERRRVRDLHTAGLSRNDIAKELGRSGSTISKIADDLGLSFDRSAVKAATEAKVADARARRAALMLNLLSDAGRLREQLWVETTYIDHGGKEFVEAKWTQPEPTPMDKLKLMQAATSALNASLRLDEHDGDGSTETVGSLLGSLFDNLTAKHAAEPSSDGD